MIPLVSTVKHDNEAKGGVSFYVLTDPTDDDSDKVKIYVHPYETGDLEDLMEFVTAFKDLSRLKNIEDNGPALFTQARLLLKEDALETFNDAHEELIENLEEGEDTNAHGVFDETWEQWLTIELQGGEMTAKELRRDLVSGSLKKPSEMSISKFVKRIKKINKFIGYLPGTVQRLSNDELLMVLVTAVPRAWKIDLQKRADYDEMTLTKAQKYFQLLEKLDPAPKQVAERTPDSGRNKSNEYNSDVKSSKHVVNSDKGKETSSELRRSNRKRGPYCPHHRSNDHEGRDCPEYQEYLKSRGRPVTTAPARSDEMPKAQEEVNAIDSGSWSDSDSVPY